MGLNIRQVGSSALTLALASAAVAPALFIRYAGAAPPPKPPATAPTTSPSPSSAFASPAATTRPFKLSTWAPAGFLKNPTALSFDRDGRCYVAQTQRREGGEMASRDDPAHKLLPDHTFNNVEDRALFGGNGNAGWGEETGGKKETITLLQDTHSTGHADKASTYYEGFDQNINDILAGVLWHEGNVYATVAPSLWRLRDTTSDAHSEPHADEVKSISRGFAVHMGYPGHNMHGLTVGPDGKIYCTMGDKGINLQPPPGTPAGRRLAYPNTGTVVRMNLDGSDPEVFCYGVRNTFEVAFDKYGNLFSVDNDGDFPTERERFVYLTEGSDTGWRFHWQFRSKDNDVQHQKADRRGRYNVWMDEKLWTPYFKGQAAYILPPLSNYSDGPAGFKYATEGSLDPAYAGYFFLAQFPKAIVTAFRAEPKGAAFVMADEKTVLRGDQCVGLTFGPDGALYGAEWGKSGFKLGQTGSVIQLDDPAAANSPLRKQTHELLREGPYKKSVEELTQLLDHTDMRVRQDAQFELARRKQFDVFRRVAFTADAGAAGQMARIHALWGIGQLANARVLDQAAAADVAEVLANQTCADRDSEIRAQAVKLLGDIVRDFGPVADDAAVVRMLGDENLRVRYFAAVTLGRFADPKAVGPLLELAAGNLPVDPYIRLAAVLGLTGTGDAPSIANASTNSSIQARLAAVVALRRMRSPLVGRFLADKEEAVVAEAARAIHDDESIPEALPALARLAGRCGSAGEPLQRRVLNANLRLGGAEHVANLVRYAGDEQNPPALRAEALDMLADWEDPAVNDRVEGIYRVWPKRDADEVRPVVTPALPALLASKEPSVAHAATLLIAKLKVRTDDAVFAQWVTDDARPAASRAVALRLLASRNYAQLGQMIDASLASREPALRAEALRVLAKSDPPRAAREIGRTLAADSEANVRERQAAYEVLSDLPAAQAEPLLIESLDRLLAGKLPPDVQLDLLESARKSKGRAVADRVAKYESSLAKTDPLAPYQPCLAGGDASRGREVFMGHAEFACVSCHSIDGTGSAVGPNLAGIGAKPDKPRRYLLESMIVPNAYIVPGYGIASFKLKDGSSLSGFIRSETRATVQLLDLEGHASTVDKAAVESRSDPTSMMPAMGGVLTPAEIRDVIEYLASLK